MRVTVRVHHNAAAPHADSPATPTAARQHLNASSNYLPADATRAFATAIALNETLESLDLSLNAFSDSVAEQLGIALAANDTLRRLDLAAFEAGGVADVDEAIGGGVGASSGSERGPRIRGRGCTALSHGLRANTRLEVLNLSRHSVRNEGCLALAASLHGSGLRDLRLADNNIGDRGCMALADELQGPTPVTTLQSLDLSGNPISDVAAEAVLDAAAAAASRAANAHDHGGAFVGWGSVPSAGDGILHIRIDTA